MTTQHVRVGVAAIIRHGKYVLMGQRKGSHGAGTWSFPGGHLEINESVLDAASREVQEEAGVCIPSSCFRKLTFTNDVFSIENKHYITLYVEADWKDSMGEPKVLEPNKCQEWRWVDFADPPSPLFLPIQNLLKDGFKFESDTVSEWLGDEPDDSLK